MELMRSPAERGFLVALGVGLAERFEAIEAATAEGLMEIDRRSCFSGGGGEKCSGKSKTWCVGRHSWSWSAAESGLMRILSILAVGAGEFEPELDGEGGM